MNLLDALGLTVPIVQAPMAGTATPALAAAVSEAGGLGSIAVGTVGADAARAQVRATAALTGRPFNVNVFCHRPARPDASRERAWLDALAAAFAGFGAAPPARLAAPYRSFLDDPALLEALVAERPRVVSFHFGLPDAAAIARLRDAGAMLLATATSVAEARMIAAAGVDAIVAQGFEAGGHRGVFDPAAADERLPTLSLVRAIVGAVGAPVIAAGGIMDGADVAAAMSAGAIAAQLGTAFIACPESAADAAHRAALRAAEGTTMTAALSGRPARCLNNRFVALAATLPMDVLPDYPIAYDAGKALNAAAKARGENGFGAQWAGTGATRARAMPAAELVRTIEGERLAATR